MKAKLFWFTAILSGIVIGTYLFFSFDPFEDLFYKELKNCLYGEKRCVRDTSYFDFTQVIDFEWDSLIIIEPKSSYPIYENEIRSLLYPRLPKQKIQPLEVGRIRFYFLKPDKTIVLKEIDALSITQNYYILDIICSERWLAQKNSYFLIFWEYDRGSHYRARSYKTNTAVLSNSPYKKSKPKRHWW